MPQITDYGFVHNRLPIQSGNRTEILVNQFSDTRSSFPQASIPNDQINEIYFEKIRTGTMRSRTMTLDVREGEGDTYLGIGTFSASAWTCTGGILQGIDDSDSNAVKMYLGDASSSMDWNVTTANTLTVVGSITASSGAIGGWNITADTIYSLASGTPSASPNDGVVIDSSNPQLIIYEDLARRIELGYLSAGVFGLKGYATNGTTVIFELSDTQQFIGGWTLDNNELSSGSVSINGTTEQILMGLATAPLTGAGVFIGLDGADYEFRAGDPAGNFIHWNATDLSLTGSIITNVQSGSSVLPLPNDSTLISYWSFDEGTGSVTIDSTSNALNGTIAGATYTAGISGQCLTFDGLSGSVLVSDNAAIQNIWDGGGALSVWINPDTDGEGDVGRVLDKANWKLHAANDSGSNIRLRFRVSFSTTEGVWATPVSIPLNSWSHVAVYYNSNDVANNPVIVVNGVAVTLTEESTPVGTRTTDVGSDLYIGNRADDALTWDGEIDEVRLYSSVITTPQAISLFENPGGVTQQGVKQLGGKYYSASSGARVQIFPDANTGFLCENASGVDIFKVLVAGTDSGDVITGDFDNGAGTKWDNSAASFTVLGQLLNVGDGSDGALNVTTGTTTINLGAADVVVKNYTSFNVSAGATLAFSNPGANGTLIVIKVQQGITLPGTINASGMGAAGGTGGTAPLGSGTDGSRALTVLAEFSPGKGGLTGSTATPTSYAIEGKFSLAGGVVKIGSGTGGGGGGTGGTDTNDGDGGAGGRGGAGLALLCGGAYNFTGTINVSGAVGTAGQDEQAGSRFGGSGGGGGGSGTVFVAYGSLTADSGTYTMAGGNGAAGGSGSSAAGPDGGQGGTGGNNRNLGGAGGAGGTAGASDAGAGSSGTAGGGAAGTGGARGTGVSGGAGGGGGAGGDKIVLALNQLF